LNKLFPEPAFGRLSLPPLLKENPNYTTKQIDEIINDQIVFARDGDYQMFLICWKGLPDSENSWSNRALQQLDSDRLEHYESRGGLHSTGSSFFQPLGNIGDITLGLQARTRRHRRMSSLWFD